MRKQRICFIFLFLVCLLMPSMAMADLSIKVINNPGQWTVVPGGTMPYFLVEVQEDEIPAPGHTVTFSISPDDGNVSFAYGGPTRVTGSNGRSGVTLRIGDRASGTYTATATSGTVSVSRTFTIGTPRSLSVSASLSNSSPNPGDTVTFTATVTENSNPVPGQTLTFSVSRYRITQPDLNYESLPVAGTVSLSSTSATTDSNGQASISVSIGSGASDRYSVTALLSDGRFGSARFRFEASPPPPTDPNTGPPVEINPPPEPIGPTGNTDVPESSTNTNTDVPESPTNNNADVPESPTNTNTDVPESPTNNNADVPESPTGNPIGTPRSGTPNTPTGVTTEPVKSSDLVVSIPVISKTVLDSGESFTMSVTVENIGEGLSPGTILGYYRGSDVGVSGTEVGTKTVSPLAAMSSSDVSISLTAPDAPGTYLYYACISSVSGESNTGNNCPPHSVSLTVRGEPQNTSDPQDTSDPPVDTKGKQPSKSVKPSDLVVSIPVISKTVLDSGESFTMSVTVENTGEGSSPEAILRYYRGSDIGVSGTEVGTKTVSPLAAMSSSDVSISLTAPDASGTYFYYACISGVPGRSNTGNTCTPHSVSLTVRGEPQNTSDAPSVVGMKFTAAQIDGIQAQIASLAATNDRSPAAMQTLAYLRSLIAMARPEQTQLLANYPNPFNPETWIPYRLAVAANVTLTIYDLKGQVVRRLALGHQAAGMYQNRSRAAYWDGRNAFGEPVASGLYFYTLTAGDFTATRKMLIRK